MSKEGNISNDEENTSNSGESCKNSSNYRSGEAAT